MLSARWPLIRADCSEREHNFSNSLRNLEMVQTPEDRTLFCQSWHCSACQQGNKHRYGSIFHHHYAPSRLYGSSIKGIGRDNGLISLANTPTG